MYQFTSESVGAGHPDKVADQISDAILDAYLQRDKRAHVACETLVTTNRVVLSGEVSSTANISSHDIENLVRDTIRKIGYTHPEVNFCADTVEITNLLHQQSPDIRQGVDRADETQQGAGDQGIMFGYATNETECLLPATLTLSHQLLKVLQRCHKSGAMPYLRPDCKSQFTMKYADDGTPLQVTDIVLSTMHSNFNTDEKMHQQIEDDVMNIVLPAFYEVLDDKCRKYMEHGLWTPTNPDGYRLYVNPTGKFVIGGPDGDTGLTGRKIIVDTYGGHGAHGGGAFSGKDPSKVDRSAAYMARYIAKNLVAAGVCDRCLIQLSYAIGIAQPISVNVNTYGTLKWFGSENDVVAMIYDLFDMTPYGITKTLNLLDTNYSSTAAYGHFGRKYRCVDGVYYFPWERLDRVVDIKKW